MESESMWKNIKLKQQIFDGIALTERYPANFDWLWNARKLIVCVYAYVYGGLPVRGVGEGGGGQRARQIIHPARN